MRLFGVTRALCGDSDEILRRFGGAPEAWLPRPVVMHGVHEFAVYIFLVNIGVYANALVGGRVFRDDEISRRLRLDFGHGMLGRSVKCLDGDLVASVTAHNDVRLSFEGVWRPGRGLLAAPLTGRLAVRALASSALREVADHLSGGQAPSAPPRKRTPTVPSFARY